ncbi:MAG TPA: aminotransferase class I/II-fold pyridoxal phosphate-dependent enzyme, partial [Anaeromyxobacteraceae bacterium]|nr:aminotransferase class I/II-fold pyridoxal phosphate-dependent enzyme [Anaeromyxobacteraceae bacterium]
ASRPAWSTSAPAQAAALAALDEEPFVAESRERLRQDREALAEGLRALGLRPLPSVAPYLAFEAPEAVALRARLMRHGLLVRDCASFGLPGWLRVAARPAAERERLLAALAKEMR